MIWEYPQAGFTIPARLRLNQSEVREQLEARVRGGKLSARPGASPEVITDLLVGKQRRDPREVVAEVVDAMSALVDALPTC